MKNVSSLQLSVNNFRRLVDLPLVSFEKGITIIIGPNGVGKSSFVESLTFLLFGARPGKIQDIRNDNAASDVVVEGEINIDDQRIKIRRTSTTAALWINETLQIQAGAASTQSVNARLRQILGGLTREQFERTYIALQGDTAGLANNRSHRERRSIIEGLLQMDILRNAIQLQESQRNVIRQRLLILCEEAYRHIHLEESARTTLDKMEKALKTEHRYSYLQQYLSLLHEKQESIHENLENAYKHQRDLQEQWDMADAEIQDLQNTLLTLQTQLEQEESRQQAFHQESENLSHLQGVSTQIAKDIDWTSHELTQAERCAPAAHHYTILQKQFQSCQKRLSECNMIQGKAHAFYEAQAKVQKLHVELQSYQNTEEAYQSAQKQITYAKQLWDTIREDQTLEEEYLAWQEKKQMLFLQEQQNNEAIAMLNHECDHALCPICLHPLSSEMRIQRLETLYHWQRHDYLILKQQVRDEHRQLEQKKAKRKHHQQQCEQIWHQANERAKSLEHQQMRRNLLHEHFQEARQILLLAEYDWISLGEQQIDSTDEDSLIQECRQLQSDLLKYEQEAHRYAQRSRYHHHLQELSSRQEQVTQQLREAKKRQENIGYNAQLQRHLAQQLKSEQDMMVQRHQQLAIHQLQHSQATQKVEENRNQLQRIQHYHQHIGKCIQETMREERLYDFLELFTTEFFRQNTREVGKRTAELLRHAINDQSILDIVITSTDLQYLDCSHVQRSINRLSGGEKNLVGLCLRIALAEQAQKLTCRGRIGFLILDEVLSSLDEERCNAVKHIFADVERRGIFEHIILITHQESIIHGWKGTILTFQRSGEKTSTLIISCTPPSFVDETDQWKPSDVQGL